MRSQGDQEEGLAQFLNADLRQVFAQRRDDPGGDLFHLPDGEAEALRQFTREHLHCPVPGCAAPEFTTVGPAARRHHFRHLNRAAAGHGDEGAFHIEAKRLLARWAAAECPDACVEVERAVEGCARRADVLVTWPDGRRVALEVQYSALDVSATTESSGWAERHASYLEHGVTPVWLFGHVPPHLVRPTSTRRPEGSTGVTDRVRLNQLQRHLAISGVPVIWINPTDDGLIATPVIDGPAVPPESGTTDAFWYLPDRLPGYGPRRPKAGDAEARLAIDALADCRLTPGGILTPTEVYLAEERRRLAVLAEQAADAAQARRAEFARQRAETSVTTTDETRNAPTRRRGSRADTGAPYRSLDPGSARWPSPLWTPKPQPAWNTHPLRQWLLDTFGSIPYEIRLTTGREFAIEIPHEQWHARIYQVHIHDRIGTRFTIDQAIATLRRDAVPHRHAHELHSAVNTYLYALHNHRLLDVPEGSIGVIADLRPAPEDDLTLF